jgi:hypothetical protein
LSSAGKPWLASADYVGSLCTNKLLINHVKYTVSKQLVLMLLFHWSRMTALAREAAAAGVPHHVMHQLEHTLSEINSVVGGCDRIFGTREWSKRQCSCAFL